MVNKIVVFDLDETLGSFVELCIFWNAIIEYIKSKDLIYEPTQKDFNELIDIKGLFNDPEKLSNIEDFMFSLSTSGVEIPNEILKDMDLDNLGIIGLVEDLNLELDLEKDEDNMSLELLWVLVRSVNSILNVI